MADVEISSCNTINIYRIKIKSNDGSIFAFGIYGKSEKDKLLKCLEVHCAAIPECFNAAKES